MKKRFIGLAAVSMLIPAMLLAQPAGKKQLVGVWAVKESPIEQSQSPLLSLAMFGGDGSFTTGVGYKTLPPLPVVQDVATEVGPGYGRWAATGDREFRLTFYAVMRKAGEPADSSESKTPWFCPNRATSTLAMPRWTFWMQTGTWCSAPPAT